MSTANIVRFDDETMAKVERHETSATSFINFAVYPESTVFAPEGGGSVSSPSFVVFDEPNTVTTKVFEETDAGEDIVHFDSIKDLIDDLET